MTQPTALSCWQCGTVLSTAGGRCPSCGAEQPTSPAAGPLGALPMVAAPPIVSARPRPAPATPASRGKNALPWVVLGVGLALVGLVAMVFGPKGGPEVAAAPPPAPPPVSSTPAPAADPNDLGIANPAAVNPMDLLGRARTRALAWSRDALLVAIKARPVDGSTVNVTGGGTIEYWFGKPTGEGLGAASKVAGKRLHIVVASSGTTVQEVATGSSRAALEPNCPMEDALQKGRAAGLPLDAPVSVTFESDDKLKKAVWRLQSESSPPVTRVLDGWTCAVVIR